jgi:twinkle protein
MAEILRDDIDFSSYLTMTEPRSKVRAASAFADELAEELAPGRVDTAPTMFSTKLRDRLHFRPGEVTAWAGYNGHKKSMFVGQVVLDLCAQNERALIVSLEMAPRVSLARMARQAAGVAYPGRNFLGEFTRWTDGRLWLFDHAGRISPALCLAVLRYFADELKGTQVVIDSMMMVCASEESMDEQKQFTTDLVLSLIHI